MTTEFFQGRDDFFLRWQHAIGIPPAVESYPLSSSQSKQLVDC